MFCHQNICLFTRSYGNNFKHIKNWVFTKYLSFFLLRIMCKSDRLKIFSRLQQYEIRDKKINMIYVWYTFLVSKILFFANQDNFNVWYT